MKTRFKLYLVVLLLSILNACSEDNTEEIEGLIQEEEQTTFIDTSNDKNYANIEGRNSIADPCANPDEVFSFSPPYCAFNNERVIRNLNFTGFNSISQRLEFGNRSPEHNTLFVDVDLFDLIIVRDFNGAFNEGDGSLTFDLQGVGQTVTLDYHVDRVPGDLPVTVTVSSSANLIRSNLDLPVVLDASTTAIHLTIHANENGYLALQIFQGGNTLIDRVYKFSYDARFENISDGSVSISGYDPVGNFNRRTFFSVIHTVNGYCGWFRANF